MRDIGSLLHTTNSSLSSLLIKTHTSDSLLWSMDDSIKHKNAPVFMSIGNGLSTIMGNQRIPSWNTAGRPSSPKSGVFGYNFQTQNLEYWTGTGWVALQMTPI